MRWRCAVPIDVLTPENAAKLVTAMAAIITAISGLAVYQGRKEKNKGEGPSQIAVLKKALDENTRALTATADAMNAQNDLFRRNVEQVDRLHDIAADLGRDARAAVSIARSLEHRIIEIAARRSDK